MPYMRRIYLICMRSAARAHCYPLATLQFDSIEIELARLG